MSYSPRGIFFLERALSSNSAPAVWKKCLVLSEQTAWWWRNSSWKSSWRTARFYGAAIKSVKQNRPNAKRQQKNAKTLPATLHVQNNFANSPSPNGYSSTIFLANSRGDLCCFFEGKRKLVLHNFTEITNWFKLLPKSILYINNSELSWVLFERRQKVGITSQFFCTLFRPLFDEIRPRTDQDGLKN